MDIHLTIRGNSDDADFKALLGHLASGCTGPAKVDVSKYATALPVDPPVVHDTQATGDDSASEPTPPAEPPAEPKVDHAAVRKEALGILQSIAKLKVAGEKCTPVAMALVKDYAKDPEDADHPKLSEVPDEHLSDLLSVAKGKLEELQGQAALG